MLEIIYKKKSMSNVMSREYINIYILFFFLRMKYIYIVDKYNPLE